MKRITHLQRVRNKAIGYYGLAFLNKKIYSKVVYLLEIVTITKRTKLKMETVMGELPKYRCHKEVWAVKIKNFKLDQDKAKEEGRETDGSAWIIPEEEGYSPIKVSHAYMRKHEPQIGGYYVLYKDGYASYSPAEAFEDGYTKIGGAK